MKRNLAPLRFVPPRRENTGIMEWWNQAFKGRKAVNGPLNFILLPFLDPIFHRSNIPLFHEESKA
jgi:hypothetical protein